MERLLKSQKNGRCTREQVNWESTRDKRGLTRLKHLYGSAVSGHTNPYLVLGKEYIQHQRKNNLPGHLRKAKGVSDAGARATQERRRHIASILPPKFTSCPSETGKARKGLAQKLPDDEQIFPQMNIAPQTCLTAQVIISITRTFYKLCSATTNHNHVGFPTVFCAVP